MKAGRKRGRQLFKPYSRVMPTYGKTGQAGQPGVMPNENKKDEDLMSSREKRKERNRNKGQLPQIKPEEKKENTLWQWLGLLSPTGKLAAGVALLLTIIGAYYTFSPKLTIDSKESLDTSNPFATPFFIKNDSLLGVYSINLKTGIRDVYAKGSDNRFSDFGTMTDVPPIPLLDSGESTTFFVTFPFIPASPVTSADIEVIVSYRPALLPFKRQKSLRFVTAQAKDGTLHWIPKALSE